MNILSLFSIFSWAGAIKILALAGAVTFGYLKFTGWLEDKRVNKRTERTLEIVERDIQTITEIEQDVDFSLEKPNIKEIAIVPSTQKIGEIELTHPKTVVIKSHSKTSAKELEKQVAEGKPIKEASEIAKKKAIEEYLKKVQDIGTRRD